MLKLKITILLTLTIIFVEAEQKTLNIMGLFSVTGSNWPGGGACLTSAQMALRDVNDRDDIFPDFKLNLTWRDGKVRKFYLILKYKY